MAYVFHMMPENELTKIINELEAKITSGTATECDANTLDAARNSPKARPTFLP